jgi:UDP-glucose 4-epimerase
VKAMVIGAGGFLGRHLCHAWARRGIDVIASSSADATGIDPATGLLPDAFRVPPGTDAVVYLAQSPRGALLPASADHLLAVNVVSAVRAATRAREAGARRFVYASTGNVYRPSFDALREGDPLCRDNWYSLSKVQAEEALALMQGELDVTSVRIFGLYGPGQSGRLVPNLAASVAQHRPVTLAPRPGAARCDGGLRISLLHVDDAVRILAALLELRGLPVLNLGGPEALDIRGLAEIIGERLGVAPELRETDRARAGDLVADIRLLQTALGPTFVPIREGLEAVVAPLRDGARR